MYDYNYCQNLYYNLLKSITYNENPLEIYNNWKKTINCDHFYNWKKVRLMNDIKMIEFSIVSIDKMSIKEKEERSLSVLHYFKPFYIKILRDNLSLENNYKFNYEIFKKDLKDLFNF